jgi:hypothetical protein
MDQQPTLGHVAYLHTLLQRLLEQYLTRTPLPGAAAQPVTIAQWHRLARHVAAEGYGQ